MKGVGGTSAINVSWQMLEICVILEKHPLVSYHYQASNQRVIS